MHLTGNVLVARPTLVSLCHAGHIMYFAEKMHENYKSKPAAVHIAGTPKV